MQQWQTRLSGSAWGCQGLPNGHRLVAINSHAMVVEYDDAGQRGLAKQIACRRLRPACSGWKTAIRSSPAATPSRSWRFRPTARPAASRCQEIRSPRSVWTTAIRWSPCSKCRRSSKSIARARLCGNARTGGNPPWHAVRLDNGNTLVTLTQARKVVEYDPTGKNIVWSTQVPLINPYAAQRLPDGNTLVRRSHGRA